MNVLVYNGDGTTPGSVKHTVETLRHFLEPYYAVSTVNAKILKMEPWTSKAAAIVFPGGADLPYVADCDPVISVIKRFVENGGVYIGFCAGGYFGTSRVEFAQGDPSMEITGPRKLKFFPGIGRGPAYSGFQYNSEKNAKAIILKVSDGSSFKTYFNGGPLFVDAETYDNVEILATFPEPTDVNGFSTSDKRTDAAAVVLSTVGKGKALLVGAHPEFIPRLLKKSKNVDFPPKLLKTLEEHETSRLNFMKYIISKAGLHCNNSVLSASNPNLTPILVSSLPLRRSILNKFEETLFNISNSNISPYTPFKVSGTTDDFEIFHGLLKSFNKAQGTLIDQEPDEVAKTIIFPDIDENIPSVAYTPNFDIQKYFNALNPSNTVGSVIMYGEVVTSTSSLLNNNKVLLESLPDNSVLHVGTIQVSGSGRSGNTWINPKGVSASTAVISLPYTSASTQKPVSIVFIQYLSMLAYTKAILSYAPGFEDLPVRIKWPNDMYALDPKYYKANNIQLLGKGVHTLAPLTDIEPAYLKIAGLLVNTHFATKKYIALLGCGLNIDNDGPTTSVNSWVDLLNEERQMSNLSPLPHVSVETLLAKYMNNFEIILDQFINYGVQPLLPQYYDLWLHSNQIVTLGDYGNSQARIVGITEDYGLLIAKELESGSLTSFTGKTFHLQPDGNSFDIFKGLISKKV
ncbi:hypothetical protein TBLA_0F02180 [Henningerozyma blattae CBS 6284]|uniref:BPL/LPL catalytic domain-containing protein n=1 Tax=Henningerozyma blattae (strain ATCC 34711 / CBS 6284 / DSM 70876 / NBRC 10599 / NRRL Y-10934 / UCD 77-7) TaxID=1071380 RepID=I2H5V8_HENB6|nr:hypothetical protein TBLA_0F02180 [Tetrapisispora blattae CBS 6284]CCH61760.1 hypothetical protein TBLA_0F02180 [Tetrapisispora blattae CBS 6284]